MPKASDNIKIYRNPNGPVVSTVNRRVLEQDGLTFKDIDGTGTLSPVNDWRNSPAERAAAYVKTLSVKEKIAQLFISDWRMAKYPITGPMADLYKDIEKKTDETGILDEGEFRGKTIFGEQYLPGTSLLLKDWFNRHVILRANATPADLADWMNQADAVCEECEHFIPVAAASNSRNENGELVFGMNDAGGVLATWPGTLGIAAAVKGSKIDLVDKFADTIRREWNACGLRKGYMYMADAVTDPRWQRTYGTFGEDPALISEIMAHIIPRIQGSDHGVTEDGVAVTTKHFPGGGARENGFDPHYAAGQWNVYATPGSLETYHLPPFAAAVKAGTSSIMPYYSKPAAAKSAVQHDLAGNTVEMKPYGFAYNKYFIDTILKNVSVLVLCNGRLRNGEIAALTADLTQTDRTDRTLCTEILIEFHKLLIDFKARMLKAVNQRNRIACITVAGAGAAIQRANARPAKQVELCTGAQRQRLVIILQQNDALGCNLVCNRTAGCHCFVRDLDILSKNTVHHRVFYAEYNPVDGKRDSQQNCNWGLCTHQRALRLF